MANMYNARENDPFDAFLAGRFSTSTRQPHPSDVREEERQDAILAKAEKAREWKEYIEGYEHEPAETLEGSSLRILREACGLSTAELGAQVGVDAKTIESFEAGRDVSIFAPAIKRVAGALRDALLEAE